MVKHHKRSNTAPACFDSLNWKIWIGLLPFVGRRSITPFLVLPDFIYRKKDRRFFRERVFTICQVWGYFDNSELAGVIAFREGWIDQLYVRPSSQRRGIGTALLRVAQNGAVGLSLWTFQRNKAARRFYEKHGLAAIEETDGSANEEKEPDVMYHWSLIH